MRKVESKILKKIEDNPKIPEKIIDSLSREITCGNIKIGQELPAEIKMAEMLGVSRGSLREGLAILEFLGVITSQSRKKTLARDANKIKKLLNLIKLSYKQDIISDLLEFRRIMDIAIVSLACERATEKDISSLEENIECLREDPNDKKADFQFHINLSKACHNTFFAAIEELLIYMYEIIRQKSSVVPGRKAEIIKEHEDILNAIKKRDIFLAREKTNYHLQNIEKVLKTKKIKN